MNFNSKINNTLNTHYRRFGLLFNFKSIKIVVYQISNQLNQLIELIHCVISSQSPHSPKRTPIYGIHKTFL